MSRIPKSCDTRILAVPRYRQRNPRHTTRFRISCYKSGVLGRPGRKSQGDVGGGGAQAMVNLKQLYSRARRAECQSEIQCKLRLPRQSFPFSGVTEKVKRSAEFEALTTTTTRPKEDMRGFRLVDMTPSATSPKHLSITRLQMRSYCKLQTSANPACVGSARFEITSTRRL